MTFVSRENSDAQGEPIECYFFKGNNQNYFYTTSDQEVVINGDTYAPATMMRTEAEIGTQEEDNLEIMVTVPSELIIVKSYAFSIAPPKLNLTIYRFHKGDDPTLNNVIYWTGVVASFVWKGHLTEIHCPSIFAFILASNVPNKYYQGSCNNTLYDFNCKLNRSSFLFTTTILALSGTTVVLTDTPTFPNGFLVTGDCFSTTASEHRMIMTNEGPSITINYPYSEVKVGDTVELTVGCDHSATTCKNKFNNKVNFAGFDLVPNYNPFIYGL